MARSLAFWKVSAWTFSETFPGLGTDRRSAKILIVVINNSNSNDNQYIILISRLQYIIQYLSIVALALTSEILYHLLIRLPWHESTSSGLSLAGCWLLALSLDEAVRLALVLGRTPPLW